jgi:hypothetical protein
VEVEVTHLDSYRAGGATSESAARLPYDPAALPLEALVEREPVLAGQRPTTRLAAAAGLHFLRLLAVAGLGGLRRAYLDAYPLPPPSGSLAAQDAAGERFHAAMAGRAPDGDRLFRDLSAALRPGGARTAQLPRRPEIAAADRAGVQRAATAWLDWCEGRFREPTGPSAWDAERMEYAFSVAAPTSDGEVRLDAAEYHGGGLDWQCFNLEQRRDPARARPPERREFAAVPTPVRFRGMPATRWWEFEDAALNLGAIESSAADLGQLLLIEFALIYGDDWQVVPIPVPVGSLARVVSLVVTDTFGRRTVIERPRPAADPAGIWRAFQLSASGQAAPTDWLFLPPAVATPLRGRPIEEVAFIRDEVANVAWAIESTVESGAGYPVSRAGGSPTTAPADLSSTDDAGSTAGPLQSSTPLIYRLASSVPAHWFPLIPVPGGPAQPGLRLRLGGLPTSADTASDIPSPLGRILEPGSPLGLFEEEVPPSGMRVSRQYALARWANGSRLRWIGRRKHPGADEPSSGLRFDTLGIGQGSSEG